MAAQTVVELYLCPRYIQLANVEARSWRLMLLLQAYGVTIVEKYWNGDLGYLPVGKPGLVWASSTILVSRAELANFCQRVNHFLFYNQAVVLPDGSLSETDLVPAAEKWLQKFVLPVPVH